MGDMDRRKAAARLTSSESPCEPPITNANDPHPPAAASDKYAASASEGICLPSIHSATTRAPRGIFSRIRAPSFSMQAAISAGDGSLPKRASSISVTATLLHSPKRLVYSAHPSRIHASLSLPTATICSPIIRSPFQTERTAGPPAKESHARIHSWK